jgi:EXLDI family protein
MEAVPNKTIYVADADLPVFEQAQELAGDNLSATIVRALRRFIEVEEARRVGFSEITLETGDQGTYTRKRFLGRELARRQTRAAQAGRLTHYTVYLTAKGRFALYTRNTSDWTRWANRNWSSSGKDQDWTTWLDANAFRLDVYETLDELREHVPPELVAAAEMALRGEDMETLDI